MAIHNIQQGDYYKMTRYLTIAAGLLFLLGAAGLERAHGDSKPQTQTQPPMGTQSQSQPQAGQSSSAASSSSSGATAIALGAVVPMEGKVVKLDKQNRTVTLQGPKGHTITVKADPQAQHFNELKVGDEIKARFFEGVVVGLGSKGTEPTEEAETVTVQGRSGQSPTVLRMTTYQMEAKIDSVDPAKHCITLTGPEGRSQTFQVKSDVDLSKAKPGETINVRYTQGVALELERK